MSVLEELREITKIYREPRVLALDRVSLSVREGELLSLIGPNGAGKTTLMKIAALIDEPTAGQVVFDGVPVDGSNRAALRKRITMVFQKPVFFSTTVRKNVEYGLKLRRLPRAEVERRVREALRLLGIEELADRHVRRLSAGEQQKVALARAIALQPELLLLDEPLANVDPVSAREIEALVGELKGHMTIVCSSHDLAQVSRLSDRVAFIRFGRIVRVGPAREVLSGPVDEQMARFLGYENVLEGSIVGHEDGLALVRLANGKLIQVVTGKTEGPCKVCLRPEDIVISRERLSSSARNVLEGTLLEIAGEGPLVRLKVDVGGLVLTAVITARSRAEMGLREGEKLYLSFKASAARVI